MELRRAYRYRIYPTRVQLAALERELELHRILYNAALEQRILAWKRRHIQLGLYRQQRELTILRREDPFYRAGNRHAQAQTLIRLDLAFQAFFRRIKVGQCPGFPRFRSRDRFDSLTFDYENGAHLRGSRLVLQCIGDVRVKIHRPYEGRIKTATVRRDGQKWFVAFAVELERPNPNPHVGPGVGMDLGLHDFIVTSDGEHINTPQFFRKAERKLRRANRHLARCQRNSNRRNKAKVQVQKIHAKVREQRRHFAHVRSRLFVNKYGLIAHEDLNIKGLARTRLAKSVNDVGWAQFLRMVTYKAAEAGTLVVPVDARLTSQTCSACGVVREERLQLADRVFSCQVCGYVLDRDHNAARNILHRAEAARQAPTREISCVA